MSVAFIIQQCVLLTCIPLVFPHCRQDKAIYVCSGTIPTNIPRNVTNVSIYDIEFHNIHYNLRPPFNNTSWSHIKILHILPETSENGTDLLPSRPYEADSYAFTLKPLSFFCLNQLQYLQFKSSCLKSMESSVFLGLVKLETLDLNDNTGLTFDSAMKGLMGSKLMSLKNLFLQRLGSTYTKWTQNNIGKNFHFLKRFPIQYLDFGYLNNVVMSIVQFAKYFPHLRKINLEYSGILAFDLIISSALFHTSATFPQLREININYPTIPRSYYTTDRKTIVNKLMVAHLNCTSIQARGVTPKGFSVHMFGAFKNATSSQHFGKLWNTTEKFLVSAHMQENDLVWTLFSLPINADGSVSLQRLDLADNNLVQVSPSLFSRSANLRFLDLSRNKLYKMSPADLNLLLRIPTLLTEFCCSENALKKLPRNIFANNHLLKIVDLSQNLLEIIDLKLSHLQYLQILNVSYNHIHFLESFAMKMFDQLVILSFKYEQNDMSNHSKPTKQWYPAIFQLFLAENPFYCSCEHIKFLHWILQQKFIDGTETLHCLLEGKPEKKLPLDTQALSRTEYMCRLPRIITIASVFSTATVIVSFFLANNTIKKYREKQREKKIKETIEKYKSDEKIQFPVFLPYCSADMKFVEQWVIPGLNAALKHVLATEKNCIATGDQHFKPGKWVKEEVIRCIKISSVVVACLSENFCKSPFCRDEVLVALTANKPVILMFLENVNEKNMPKSICRHFSKTVRAKWSLAKDGTYVLIPGFNILCSTILELMNQPTEGNNYI